MTQRRRVVIAGAGGRDFHNFNVVFRDDPTTEVVAFTATQIPGIDDRRYPHSLAGAGYPLGIPIKPEADLPELIARHGVDEVVFAYSDVSHAAVMHLASTVLATGADFRLLGPNSTMLESTRPVVAVVATRTGAGKSPLSRHIAQLLRSHGLRPVIVRHPMPYGDLETMRVQRFANLADIDAAEPTIEEREEYEAPVRCGFTMFAGVDYEAILRRAETEADVIVWDGGNNDFAFFEPTLTVTAVDPLRAGDELVFHPGETNLRLADIVVITKADQATQTQLDTVQRNARAVNPSAAIVQVASQITLDDGPALSGLRVLVIDDGPTLTHGGMPYGAGYVAAVRAGATIVDPRPTVTGSIRTAYESYPHLQNVLPALGYGGEQLADLRSTVAASDCDVIVSGTPVDLARLLPDAPPIRRASYRVREIGTPTFSDVLRPHLARLADLRP